MKAPPEDRMPTDQRVGLALFDELFVSWGEVCAAARHAGMSDTPASG